MVNICDRMKQKNYEMDIDINKELQTMVKRCDIFGITITYNFLEKNQPAKIHVLIGIFLDFIHNSIANAKKSGAKNIHFQIEESDGLIRLIVSDNGAPFLPESLEAIQDRREFTGWNGHGFGLVNFAKGVESSGGKFEIQQEESDGGILKKIMVSFPIAQSELTVIPGVEKK